MGKPSMLQIKSFGAKIFVLIFLLNLTNFDSNYFVTFFLNMKISLLWFYFPYISGFLPRSGIWRCSDLLHLSAIFLNWCC